MACVVEDPENFCDDSKLWQCWKSIDFNIPEDDAQDNEMEEVKLEFLCALSLLIEVNLAARLVG